MNKMLKTAIEAVQACKAERRSVLLKGASVISDTGMVGGATTGAMVGGGLGGTLARAMPGGKLKALVALMGLSAGTVAGGVVGHNLGKDVHNSRKVSKYNDILADAEMNRRKAMLDSTAMRAFSGAGLARSPYTPR